MGSICRVRTLNSGGKDFAINGIWCVDSIHFHELREGESSPISHVQTQFCLHSSLSHGVDDILDVGKNALLGFFLQVNGAANREKGETSLHLPFYPFQTGAGAEGSIPLGVVELSVLRCDEIENDQAFLIVCFSQTSPQLLQEYRETFGRA